MIDDTTDGDRTATHLRAALDHAGDPEARYHLRAALQRLTCERSTDAEEEPREPARC